MAGERDKERGALLFLARGQEFLRLLRSAGSASLEQLKCITIYSSARLATISANDSLTATLATVIRLSTKWI